MTIYSHSSPHFQLRPSLVHPFLPQDLDLPCNAQASCYYSYNILYYCESSYTPAEINANTADFHYISNFYRTEK